MYAFHCYFNSIILLVVVVSDGGTLDEGSVSGLVVFPFCVVGFDSTVVGWVVVGDADVSVAPS